MLVCGFEHRPALGIPYAHAYYPEFMERAEFKGITDGISGTINRAFLLLEKVSLAAEKVREKRGLRAGKYASRFEFKKMIPHLKDLYNGSLVGTKDVTPLTDVEVAEMAGQIGVEKERMQQELSTFGIDFYKTHRVYSRMI